MADIAMRYLFDEDFNFIAGKQDWIPEARLHYWLYSDNLVNPDNSGWYTATWNPHGRRSDWMSSPSNEVPNILKSALLLLKG